MDQKQLCVAAKKQQGLTSDNQLALRLGVDRSRVSKLVRGIAPADEAEIAMLCDMAGIDLHIGLAAVHKDREKNPAKRAYWEKISMQFAMAMMLIALAFTGFPEDASAKTQDAQSINYANVWAGKKLSYPNSVAYFSAAKLFYSRWRTPAARRHV